MDLFRRLLGSLQWTVDYISTFTTYLLGDEAHPGAEGSGSTRETVPHRSHHDCDVETAHYGDISPAGDLKAFEEPPIAETIPPHQEIPEAPGKDFHSAQATEASLRASKLPCKDEGQEDVGQKLAEPPDFPADAPKPRSSTTQSFQQRDLEGPVVTGWLHQWEPEGNARKGAVQQELREEIADMKDWKTEKPLAGGQEHEELGRAGEAEETWQKEQEEKEEDEQEASGGAESDGEEQTGFGGAGGFQQQVAKMVEDLRSQPDGELVGGTNTEDNQLEESDIEVGAVPDSAETVTEDGDGHQRGMEEAGMEAPQQGRLEGFVRNEGTQWREQEENEEDCREESVVEEQKGDGTAWRGRVQQEMVKMVEDLRSEPNGQLLEGTNVKDNKQEEVDIKAGDERVQLAVPGIAETRGDQPGGPEGETEARSSPQWEPEETVTLEVQEEDLKRVTEKRDGQQRGLEEPEVEAVQQVGLEGFVRHEETQWREQEENEGDGREESVVEEQKGDGTAWMGRFQEEMVKMVQDQESEPDGQLLGGANIEDNQQEESDIEAGDEEVQPAMPDSAETREDQLGGSEGEAEVRSSPQWEPEETVTLEEQEEDPKGVTEKGDGPQRGLEEPEIEVPPQGGLQGFVRNEEAQRREQEKNEEDGREEPVVEEQRRDGTAWRGRVQQEIVKMVEDLRSEPDGQLLGEANMEDNQQEESDIEAGDEAVQPAGPDSVETREDQLRGPEGETVARSIPQWKPEETVTLEVKEEDPKGVTEKGDGPQRGLEGLEMEVPPQGGLEGLVRSEETQWREQEDNEGDEQEATGGEEQRGEGAAWTGRSQQEMAKMAKGQCLEAEGQLSGWAETENCQQGEPDIETGEEGFQQTMLDGAEMGGDQQGGQEEEGEGGSTLQWEPEKTVALEEHPEKGNGQQQGLEGTEEREGHQHGTPRRVVRNEAETEEEGQEEQMGEQRSQWTDPEALAGITVLEEVAVAAKGQEPQGAEGTERSQLHEPLGDKAPVDPCCLPGAGAFPDEVPSLDTSPQKERVLLRRKSSIRRAPSLKRSRPPVETPPPQETGVEENSPSQPPSSGRPNLRHAGFGPMHPNMMAELKTRLRRPQ